MRIAHRWMLLLSLAGLSFSPAARADDDKAGAQAAFDFGKKLMLEGRFAEACPKLQESLRLDPGVGTMLYLADCWEKTGKSASAWGQFREAEALASRSQDPREQIAKKRADALEPKLNKVIVSVPSALTQIKGLRVQRDDSEVGSGLWGVPIPVDPGAHKLTVSAPEKKPWSTDFAVEIGAKTATVSLPDHLEDEPANVVGTGTTLVPGDTSAGWNEPSERGRTQRIIAIVVGGAGVVGLGVGAFFGLRAKSLLDHSNADGHCNAGNVCDPTGRDARNDAESAATVSTVVFGVGAAAVVTGAVLFFTAPHGKPASARVSPWMSPQSGGGVGVSGTF